jgi:hypothetical protein
MRAKWMARTVAIVGVAGLLGVASAAPSGSTGVISEPLAEGLIAPLGLAVDDSDGIVYVTQSFAEPSVLSAIVEGDLVTAGESPVAGASVSGVSALDGEVVFTVGNPEEAVGQLRRVTGPDSELIFDTAAFEAAENPDQVNTYGFRDLTPECADEVGIAFGDPNAGLPYTGLVDSNPYGVASLPDGTWVIADAGANDLVRVNESGVVLDVVVLPPVPLVVPSGTPGVPECVWGSTYDWEPVPTDVELGPDGLLYVTGLPGGPEDPSFGARGVVFSVDPETGAVDVVASGFAGATGLAVTPDGSIYVAELFGGRISVVVDGAPVPYVTVEGPAAVEYSNGVLFATIRALPGEEGPPNGAVVTVTLPGAAPPPPPTTDDPTSTTTATVAAPVRVTPAFTG